MDHFDNLMKTFLREIEIYTYNSTIYIYMYIINIFRDLSDPLKLINVSVELYEVPLAKIAFGVSVIHPWLNLLV